MRVSARPGSAWAKAAVAASEKAPARICAVVRMGLLLGLMDQLPAGVVRRPARLRGPPYLRRFSAVSGTGPLVTTCTPVEEVLEEYCRVGAMLVSVAIGAAAPTELGVCSLGTALLGGAAAGRATFGHVTSVGVVQVVGPVVFIEFGGAIGPSVDWAR